MSSNHNRAQQHDGEGTRSPFPYQENTQPVLPAEVIDLIVDELGADTDQEASCNELFAVALASRRLCIRAHRHMFSDLHLTLAHDSGGKAETGTLDTLNRMLDQLHDILIHGIEFPDLAMVYHLRSVWITIKSSHTEDLSVILSLPMLSDTLRLLHGLSHGITCFGFEIATPTRPGEMMFPPTLSSEKLNPKFSQELYGLCRSPHLKTLHFKHVVMPSTMLRGTHIENFHLREVTFEDYPEELPSNLHHRLDLEPGFVVQPTALTLVCTIRTRSLSEITDVDPMDISNRFGVGIHDLVEFFHTSYHTNLLLSRQEVFSRLTRLTLMDFDYNRIQLDLLPHLQSLKIIQSLFLPCISNFGYSTLHSFFEPEPGVTRSLGSTKNLTVETDVVYSRMFIYDRGHDENDIPYIAHLKPTRASWRIVDRHSSSALRKLERIDFMFKFLFKSDEMLPSPYNDYDSFIATNKTIIASYFPRLSALRSFSLDAMIEKEENPMRITRVEFKLPRTER